jgi:hypothetical protein
MLSKGKRVILKSEEIHATVQASEQIWATAPT